MTHRCQSRTTGNEPQWVPSHSRFEDENASVTFRVPVSDRPCCMSCRSFFCFAASALVAAVDELPGMPCNRIAIAVNDQPHSFSAVVEGGSKQADVFAGATLT